MPNAFNYRCPACGSADHVVIDAYVPVLLDGKRVRVIDDGHIGSESWYSTNPASCDACGYAGYVENFEIRGAQVIPLPVRRRS